MRFLMWLLVGLTCLMLASCPAKDTGADNNQATAAGDDNSDDADWGE